MVLPPCGAADWAADRSRRCHATSLASGAEGWGGEVSVGCLECIKVGTRLTCRAPYQDQGRLPGGRLFRLRRVTWKSTPSNQGCLLLVGPFVPQGSFTPVSLRGPAAIRHPWRGAALAASMRLGPRNETCAQPAPKSRLAVTGLFVHEDQKQIKSRTTASRLKPVLQKHHVPPVGLALAGKRPAQAATVLLIGHPICGSELARECFISNTRYPVDVPTSS